MAVPKLKKAIGNSASTTLSSSVSDSDTSFPLTSDTNFQAASGEGMVIMDEGESSEEYGYSTALAGSSLSIALANRGLEGGSAQGHSSGATVKGILSSTMWNDLVDSIIDNLLDQTTGDLKLQGTATVTDILDEDDMASDSATALATQQSIKAYVDTQVGGGSVVIAYASASQSITAGADTKVQINTEVVDSDSKFDNATNYRYTATGTEKILVVGHVRFEIAADNDSVEVQIKKNGSLYALTQQVAETAGSMRLECTAIVPLTAGEYVELFCKNSTSNDTINTSGASYDGYLHIAQVA